jgi:hypothetical protein
VNRFLILAFVILASMPVLAGNAKVIDAGSMAATITSSAIRVESNRDLSVQAIVSGGSTPIGTFTLAASNDCSTYTTMDTSSYSWTGNSGSVFYDVKQPTMKCLELVYTRTSGSGTLNATVELKETGVPHK